MKIMAIHVALPMCCNAVISAENVCPALLNISHTTIKAHRMDEPGQEIFKYLYIDFHNV